MEIDEVRKKKAELEEALARLISDFEAVTDVNVRDVEIQFYVHESGLRITKSLHNVKVKIEI